MNDDEIFDKMKRFPLGERTAFLNKACQGRPQQLKRLKKLLEADSQTDSLFDPAAMDSTLEHRPGTSLDRIGNYRLLQRIGEGGFGIVYMAEQTKPIRRKVAIKVIKPGMDSKAVLARFDAERQALAMMDHPNIATVFDGGVSDLGRPYFVMELVKGVPITTYCDDNRLGTRERLGLFVDVCKAVQHAHTKGIIHRDIKPSNVLVTLHDGSPVVKVIDFGVAKAMHLELTEQTLFTAFGQMIGTPQYMSPEQAEMSGLDVDTRSDVYSLGVMLYEMLTGTTPLETDAIRGAGYAEMQRLILETESPRPSARINSSDDKLTHIAKHRSIDRKKLSEELRGDVDWIVMKALEKDRSRRYETAERLAQDVQNHLNDEIVSARPPSRRYRLKRYVRKQKTLLLTVSTVIASLLLAVGALTYSLDATQTNNAMLQEERDRFRELLTEVAVTHALGGNLEQAKRMAEEMYGPDAVSEKAFINGVARFYGGDQPGAVASLRRSCAADPTNVAANAMLAIIYEWDTAFAESDLAWNRARANALGRDLKFHDEFFFAYAQTYRQPDAAIQKMEELVERRRSPIAQAQLAVLLGENMFGAESEEECQLHLKAMDGAEGPIALIANAKTTLGRTNNWVEACDLFIRSAQLRLTLKTGGNLPPGFIDDTEDLIDRLPPSRSYPIYFVLQRIWYGLQGEELKDKLLEVLEDHGKAGRSYFLDHVRYFRSEPLTAPPLEAPETMDDAFRLLLHCHLDSEFRERVRGEWKEMLDNVQKNTRTAIFVLWLGLLVDDGQGVKERAREILDRVNIPTSEQRFYHVEPMLRNLAGRLSDHELIDKADKSRSVQKAYFKLQLALKSLADPSHRQEAIDQLGRVVDLNVPWLYGHFLAQLLKHDLVRQASP